MWTPPPTYEHTQIITASKLNTNLKDNLDYLYARPTSVVTWTNQGYSTTSSSLVAVDDQLVYIGIQNETTSNFWLWVSGFTARFTTASTLYQQSVLDVWWANKGIYVSEYVTGAELTYGLSTMAQQVSTNTDMTHKVQVLIPKVSPDSHIFVLHWRTDVDTLSQSDDTVAQFGVTEV